MRFTQKQLRQFAEEKIATDITRANCTDRDRILNEEGTLHNIGYSAGTNGHNGLLMRGHNTNKLYVITARATSLFIFD